jgi:hypothetical protein
VQAATFGALSDGSLSAFTKPPVTAASWDWMDVLQVSQFGTPSTVNERNFARLLRVGMSSWNAFEFR